MRILDLAANREEFVFQFCELKEAVFHNNPFSLANSINGNVNGDASDSLP